MIFASAIITGGMILYAYGSVHSLVCTMGGVLCMAFGITAGLRMENKLNDRIDKLEKELKKLKDGETNETLG